jgi:hypothetical protein
MAMFHVSRGEADSAKRLSNGLVMEQELAILTMLEFKEL